MEVIFRSERFEVIDGMGDGRGFFTEKVGNFFLAGLQKAGYRPVMEEDEWGVKLVIKEPEVVLFVKISATWNINSPEGSGLLAFKCLTGYTLTGKGKFLNFLGKVSPEEKLGKLNWVVKNLLSSEGINVISIKNDIVSM